MTNVGSATSTLKIAWALDPCRDEGKRFHTAPQFLNALCQQATRLRPEIKPVCVLTSRSALGTPMAFRENDSSFASLAALHLQHQLSGMPVPALTAPHFLYPEATSLRGSVAALLAYAKEEGSDLILVGTHAVAVWLAV